MTPPSPTSHRWHLMVAVGAGLCMMAASIGLTALSFFTAPVLAEYHFAVASYTLYYTLFGLSAAAAMPLAGALSGRLGARGLLLLGGTIAAGGLLLFSVAGSLPGFYLAGVVLGLGFGLSVQYVPIVLVNRWFVARKGLVLGLVLGGSGVGGAVLSQVVPSLIRSHGWRTAFVALAAVMALLTWLPALFLVRTSPSELGLQPYGHDPSDTAQDPSALPGLTFKQAVRSPWLLLVFGATVVLGGIHAMSQHLANYLSGVPKDVTVGQIAFTMTVVTLSLVVLKPLLGLLVDRLGLTTTLVVTLGISALVAFASAFVTSVPLYAACMVGLALGFANGTVTPPLVAVATLGPRDFARIWGVLGTAYPIGSAIGAPLWGMVKDQLGSYGWGFVSVPVWTALVVAGYLVAMRRGPSSWAADATTPGSRP